MYLVPIVCFEIAVSSDMTSGKGRSDSSCHAQLRAAVEPARHARRPSVASRHIALSAFRSVGCACMIEMLIIGQGELGLFCRPRLQPCGVALAALLKHSHCV